MKMETRENQTSRSRAHRVYSVMRNLGIAFGLTVVAMITCAAEQGKTIYDCPSGGKYTLSFDDKGASCVKCDIPGHEWSSKTGWGEK